MPRSSGPPQHAAAQYSLSTGHLFETLVRELPYRHAEWVLELARRINDEATAAGYQSLPLDVRGAGTPARSTMAGPGSAAAVVMMALIDNLGRYPPGTPPPRRRIGTRAGDPA